MAVEASLHLERKFKIVVAALSLSKQNFVAKKDTRSNAASSLYVWDLSNKAEFNLKVLLEIWFQANTAYAQLAEAAAVSS